MFTQIDISVYLLILAAVSVMVFAYFFIRGANLSRKEEEIYISKARKFLIDACIAEKLKGFSSKTELDIAENPFYEKNRLIIVFLVDNKQYARFVFSVESVGYGEPIEVDESFMKRNSFEALQ